MDPEQIPDLSNESEKVLDFSNGKIMAVTDLHGNIRDFEQTLRRYRELKSAGKADYLIFLGDLIHGRKGPDFSVEIIDKLIEMRTNEPGSDVYALIGNHELVHIYHIELWKGDECFTKSFEERIAGNRSKYIRFFMDMPFAIRTVGGVLLHHVGASKMIGTHALEKAGISQELFRKWPHHFLLHQIFQSERLKGKDPLAELAPDAGRIFTSLPEGKIMWEMFMNKNERFYSNYPEYQKRFLKFMFRDHNSNGKVMVTGHVQVPRGLQIVNDYQLRLSSGWGAKTDAQKIFVVFDAAKKYGDALTLAKNCLYLYGTKT